MNYAHMLELLDNPQGLIVALAEDGSLVETIKNMIIPPDVLNELKRQSKKWGLAHDLSHVHEEWYATLAGCWNNRPEWRRQAELRDAIDRMEAGDDDAEGDFDHVMAEYAAIVISYFRAKAEREKREGFLSRKDWR